MFIFKNFVLLIVILIVGSTTLYSQLMNCDQAIVPDDLFNGKVTINLSDMCSACGPYGGNNGTIENPPNGATGCGIIRFSQSDLTDCVNLSIDPQSTEKTDFYLDPTISNNGCFNPDGSTSSQDDVFTFNISEISFTGGFFDLLVCSQSTGNRSFEIIYDCCPQAGTGRDTSVCNTDQGLIDLDVLLTGADSGGTWARISGTGGSFNEMNGTFSSYSDATTSTFEYTPSGNDQSPSCDATAQVTVTVNNAPDAGMDEDITLCSSDDSINLYDSLGQNIVTTGYWIGPSDLGNGYLGTYDPSIHNNGLYQYVIAGSGVCENDTSDVHISISSSPSAGTNGSLSFCDNETMSRELITGLGGMPDEGGSWSPSTTVPGFFDPTMDTPGSYIYTVMGSNPCENSSATVMVSVSDVPDPGTDHEITICSDVGTFNLIDSLGGNPDGGGMWTPSLNSGGNIYDPVIDGSGMYTYSFNIEGCDTESATLTININSPPVTGNNASMDICKLHDPVNLYSFIGDPDQTGTWSGPSMLDNGYLGTFDPSEDQGGDYYYTIPAEESCVDLVLVVTVNVFTSPYVGESTSMAICSSDNPMDLTMMLGENISPEGHWEPALYSGSNMYSPMDDGEGSFTYIIEETPECPEQTAVIEITVYDPHQAGQSTMITLTELDFPVDLFEVLEMTPEPGGHWDPAPQSGTGMLDPTIDEEGIYTYHTYANGPCEADFAHVEVIILPVMPIPTMGTWGIIILGLLMLILAVRAMQCLMFI